MVLRHRIPCDNDDDKPPEWPISLAVWKRQERQALPALLFRAAFVLAVTYPPLSVWLPATTETLVGADAHSGVLHAVEMIGLATMAIGATFALYSQNQYGRFLADRRCVRSFGRHRRYGAVPDFAQSGIVGQCVLFIGLLIVFPTVIQFLITIELLVAVRLQVGIEERVLVGEMGEDYQAYKRRVRRWL